jgi:hypothetical protein
MATHVLHAYEASAAPAAPAAKTTTAHQLRTELGWVAVSVLTAAGAAAATAAWMVESIHLF